MSGRRRGGLLAAGAAGVLLVGLELPYVNWRSLVPPVDAAPLLIRQDAKGDGAFGAPRSGSRRHRGVDLAAPLGAPVRAIRSGRVVEVGTHRGLGRFVVIEHHGGLTSLYAHLATVGCRVNDRVRQGQVIGAVGKTGNARHHWITPHVHLELVRDGEPVDPATLGLHAMLSSPETTVHERDGG